MDDLTLEFGLTPSISLRTWMMSLLSSALTSSISLLSSALTPSISLRTWMMSLLSSAPHLLNPPLDIEDIPLRAR